MQVTVITPIAQHHEKQFVRCADSVRKQTVECRHLHMIDVDGKGPGYIRNKLLQQVKTKFVVFLDADDYLEPTFVEECMRVSTPGNYVFTDWYEGNIIKSTPKGAFWDTAWHLITCLIHTDMMQVIHGFNEKLPAMEDTEIFLKFDRFAYCGTQILRPLVHYTNDGKRSKDARTAGLIPAIKADFSRRFRVGCCSDENLEKRNRPPIGKKLPGDIKVQALWEGNCVQGGAVTGRRYDRASVPMLIWIDPRDAKARPDLYYIFPEPTVVDPPKASRRRIKRPHTFADMLHVSGMLDLPPGAANVLPVVVDGNISPDFDKLNTIAQRICCHVESKPKRDTNTDSHPTIVVGRRPDTVRTGSALGSPTAKRQAVAVGNG